MKPYSELTEDGKVRRLRDLAADAVAEYPLKLRRLSLIRRAANTTFSVETSRGPRYALRIGPARSAVLLDVRTEVAWLERLAADEGVSASRPVPNRSGRMVTVVARPDVPGPRTCVLFEWIPGRPVGDEAGPLDYAMLGEVAAELHEQAARWRRRHRLRPLVWDRVFYYPGEPAVIYDGRFRKLMTPEVVKLIKRVERKAETELKRLREEVPASMLHGGLHPWNVHLHQGRLHVFDFEEVMLGAPVQDIAITLWHARSNKKYDDLLSAFVEGYRTVREWPVEYAGQVNLLMAARSLMLLNYAFRREVANRALVDTVIEQISEVL